MVHCCLLTDFALLIFLFFFFDFVLFRHLLIVGNLKMLSCNTVWGKVIEHCRGIIPSSLVAKAFVHVQERDMSINIKENVLAVDYHR